MKHRLAVLMAALVVAIAACTFAPVVEAHRVYYDWQANNTVYNLWNSHCGNGSTWVCVNRKLNLGSTPVGDHSWATYYSWQEVTIWGTNNRWCDVYVRYDAHIGAVVQMYQNETCHS